MNTMENETPFENLLRRALAPEDAGHEPPPAALMRARRLVKPHLADGADPITLIASFLNMRVKLYHAVIAFLVIWLAFLFFGSEEQTRSIGRGDLPVVTNIAAVSNATAPACIKTYVRK
jgi:hypothetical protein